MQFRVGVFVTDAKNQGITLVSGLDVGEVGSCVIDIPTEQYELNPEDTNSEIIKIATKYMAKVVGLEISKVV